MPLVYYNHIAYNYPEVNFVVFVFGWCTISTKEAVIDIPFSLFLCFLDTSLMQAIPNNGPGSGLPPGKCRDDLPKQVGKDKDKDKGKDKDKDKGKGKDKDNYKDKDKR